MKRIHLLRFNGDPVELAPLIEAVRADGGRVGWLDLKLDEPVPAALATPASLDVLRAVAVGPHFSIVVKPTRGEPALRDLLREHFRGCRVVLVVGVVDAPLLERDGDGWRVGETGYSSERLAAVLRKPRPFS